MTQQQSFDERAAFPILDEMDFFNHAGVAPVSGPAAAAIADYATKASTHGNVKASWYKRVDQVKAATAELIGAAGGHEIAMTPNTSTGLAQVARGLDLQAGDRVVITNVEYPANRYPWEDVARRQGVELVEVAQRPDGRIAVEDVVAAIDGKTKVVSLSHVQFASGFRIDPAPIAQAVHKVGGYLCLDGIQSVGVLPVDVQAMGVDFLSADGHKWMLGPEGAGIFYCRTELLDQLAPLVVGWMNMVDAHNFSDYRFEWAGDAQRFEPGTQNIPGILGLGASLDLLLGVGIDAVWARVEALTARLCEGLAGKGYPVYSPRGDGERSGIVIFESPPEGSSNSPDAAGVVRALAERDIHVIVRNGRVRVSPHFYNRAEQIDRLIAALP